MVLYLPNYPNFPFFCSHMTFGGARCSQCEPRFFVVAAGRSMTQATGWFSENQEKVVPLLNLFATVSKSSVPAVLFFVGGWSKGRSIGHQWFLLQNIVGAVYVSSSSCGYCWKWEEPKSQNYSEITTVDIYLAPFLLKPYPLVNLVNNE